MLYSRSYIIHFTNTYETYYKIVSTTLIILSNFHSENIITNISKSNIKYKYFDAYSINCF